uniref:Uncharacterized protein n=1 Tax=Oryza sativa subsp. japonica TaxID=39947 RepID=Q5Z842_ORYSJ|nr:hypothetical protein [Oryza sativa Japonica Group]
MQRPYRQVQRVAGKVVEVHRVPVKSCTGRRRVCAVVSPAGWPEPRSTIRETNSSRIFHRLADEIFRRRPTIAVGI